MGLPLVEEALLALARQRRKHSMVTSALRNRYLFCVQNFFIQCKNLLLPWMEIWGSVVVLQAWECGWMLLWHWGNAQMQHFRTTALARRREKCVTKGLKEWLKWVPRHALQVHRSCHARRGSLSSPPSLPFCVLQPMQAGSPCASDKSKQWQRHSGSSQRSEDRWRAGKACNLLQGSSISLFARSALYFLLSYSMSEREQSPSLRPILLLPFTFLNEGSLYPEGRMKMMFEVCFLLTWPKTKALHLYQS